MIPLLSRHHPSSSAELFIRSAQLFQNSKKSSIHPSDYLPLLPHPPLPPILPSYLTSLHHSLEPEQYILNLGLHELRSRIPSRSHCFLCPSVLITASVFACSSLLLFTSPTSCRGKLELLLKSTFASALPPSPTRADQLLLPTPTASFHRPPGLARLPACTKSLS